MNTKITFHWLSLVSICLFLSINAAGQTDWTFVALTSSRDIVSIDKNFIRSPNGITRVWEKVVSSDDTYRINLMEWECSKKRFRFVQEAVYDANGIISRSDKKSVWRTFVPDSTGMLLYLNICEVSQNESSGKQNIEKSDSSFAQITVRKANLMSEASSQSDIIGEVFLGEKLILVSEESVGVWYPVINPRTKSQAWLNGNHFKIVKVGKPAKKLTPNSRKRRN
jgi:hypothetical protein